MAALHWARVSTVYYGATIADAVGGGFNELHIPATEMIRLGGSKVQVVPGLLSTECAALFSQWRTAGQARSY